MSHLHRAVLGGTLLLVLAGGLWGLGILPGESRILPITQGDTISSWSFKGAYEDGGTLEERARTEIDRLTELLGSGEFPDYQLYVAIAAQYELLGEGKKAYLYLDKALAIDSTQTGLAWMNLGALFDKLGAFETARTAYAKAVESQSAGMEFHVARISFLIERFPNDTAAIEGAFSEANRQFGDAATFYQIRAQWMTKLGNISGAIAAWEKVKSFMPPGQQTAIDREIARLQTKL